LGVDSIANIQFQHTSLKAGTESGLTPVDINSCCRKSKMKREDKFAQWASLISSGLHNILQSKENTQRFDPEGWLSSSSSMIIYSDSSLPPINSQCLSCRRFSKFSSTRASACFSFAVFHFIKTQPRPTGLITSNAPQSPRDKFAPSFRPETLHRSSYTSLWVILLFSSRGLILSLIISAVSKTE
jgi:hypothetical protein